MPNEDKSTRYHRLRRRASVLSTGAAAVALLALALTPGARWLADLSLGYAALYVVLLAVILEIVTLPFAFEAGWRLERKYGLSRESAGGWGRDRLKGFAIGLPIAIVAAEIVYRAARAWPDWWWLPAAAMLTAGMVALAHLAPVLLMPLLVRVKPLANPALSRRLAALTERAGVPIIGVFEWALGARTSKANAALTGFGSTRRILVSDTLLASYSDDEIEVILAHELSHHVHHDLWSAIGVEAGMLFAGGFAAHVVITVAGPWLGIRGPGDVAGLPLLLLAAGALSLVLAPAARAVSRRHERRADAYALRMTGAPDAFISAMKRLGAQNLAEERTSGLARLFQSHPPLAERIERARALTEA
ncbi:MAG TPA: M48 family metalloprotease [Vicinamibacterales bacterium]|nr:M48 family metalloprotease [Vicinamibacterales bacterium]